MFEIKYLNLNNLFFFFFIHLYSIKLFEYLFFCFTLQFKIFDCWKIMGVTCAGKKRNMITLIDNSMPLCLCIQSIEMISPLIFFYCQLCVIHDLPFQFQQVEKVEKIEKAGTTHCTSIERARKDKTCYVNGLYEHSVIKTCF